MKTIGVGLIGSGFMGKAHALAWNAVRPVFGDVPDIRLVHLGEMNEELAQAKAAEFGFEKAPATGARSSPTLRSTSSRSPRRTSSIWR